MAGIMRRSIVLSLCVLWGLCVFDVTPVAAQVTPGPAKVISSPGVSSQSPTITFQPLTGMYGIAYKEPGPRRWVGGFLDQDGNRLSAPIGLATDAGNIFQNLREVVPFPWSTSILATFQAYGYNAFGSNVFVGDAAGVGFATNGLTSGVVNYTNNGNDGLVANNCGEHEDIGASTVDFPSNRFFTSYNQLFHFWDNGLCKTSGSRLMAGYHQNALPFSFSEGPFPIEDGAGSQDAIHNPGTGHVWLGYAAAAQGRLSVRLLRPTGVAGGFDITAADGVVRGNLRFAVHPGTNNVLAVWTARNAANQNVLIGRLFNQNGVALTADMTLSNPATENVIRAQVAATADNFFVAAFVPQHVLGRVLTPAGGIASDWTRLDFATDPFGNPVNVYNAVDLVANPVRGTYGLVFDSLSDVYFVEVTATAGMPVTVVVDGTGAGSVTSDPPGINCPGTCSMSVPPGTDVELFAAAANFSDFTGWGGACSGAAACSFTATTPQAITATFTRQRFPITVNKIGEGTVTSAPAGIDCGPTCTADFDGGSQLQLTATPAPGWRFGGWSGACTGDGPCDLQVTGAEAVTATFIQQHTLTIVLLGNGGGQVVSDLPGLDCPAASCTLTVDTGTFIQITAIPDATSRFSMWTRDCNGTDPLCRINGLNGDLIVNATFTRAFDLQVNTVGSGSVQSAPSGIDCPGDCSERFDTGSSVTLSASAAPGWRFTGWSGDPVCSGTGACTITAADYAQFAVTANFVEQFTLNVALAGNGSGQVTGDGITCPGDCAETYDANTPVALNATADPSSEFTGWSGACSGTASCVVTMSAAQSVTATFTLRRYELEVTLAGAGGGIVNGSGITCPGDCSEIVEHGTPVTLTAAPDAASIFTGWSGACSGTGACVISMTSAQSVVATFMPKPTWPLTVTLAGDGSGSVSSAPAGISCGTTCQAEFDAGSLVTLTPTAGATSTFAGWSGACSGTGACVVTMSAAQSVTATFDAVTIASVTADVMSLTPIIGAGNVNSVTSKLSNAQASLSKGNKTAAANQINAAVNQIQALVKSGKLNAAAGDGLILDLQQILIGL